MHKFTFNKGIIINNSSTCLFPFLKSRLACEKIGSQCEHVGTAIYEEVENWKCFENCAPHEGREYLTTICDSLSCAVVIA